MKKIFLILLIFISTLFSENIDDDMLDEFNDDIQVETKQKSDPFKSYNIAITQFNDKVYYSVWKPVAISYKNNVNQDIRQGVNNIFSNLKYPINFVNNILQLKIKNACIETERFLINSTIGLLGFFDVAKKYFNLEPKKEDFGQTLGYWGVSSGPHIVLPFFGPSNLRDMISFYPDGFVDPTIYNSDRNYNIINNSYTTVGVMTYDRLNKTSLNINLYDNVVDGSLSKYEVLKNSYEQKREMEINR